MEIVENDMYPEMDVDAHKLEMDEIHEKLAKLKAARHAAKRDTLLSQQRICGESAQLSAEFRPFSR